MAEAKLIVLYPPPTDVAAFDKAYRDEHLPLMRSHLGGLRVAVTTVADALEGTSPHYLMAEIFAPSLDLIKAALATPGGKEIGAHAAAISTGGRPTVLFGTEDVHQL